MFRNIDGYMLGEIEQITNGMRGKWGTVVPLIALALLGGTLLASGVGVADSFDGGDGTINDPYVVTNATELQSINENLSAHYVLGNGINATVTRGWNGGDGFIPIGNESHPFTGSLDGNGHSVSGLTLRTDSADAGIFRFNEGRIEDISFRNIDVRYTPDDNGIYTGGVAGRNYGKILNVTVTGRVEGEIGVAGVAGANGDGGFFGPSRDGTVKRTSASVDIVGRSGMGGLVGANYGDVVDSHATGTITQEPPSFSVGGTGGAVAANEDGTLEEVYAAVELIGDDPYDEFGGLVGRNRVGENAIRRSYWDTNVSVNDSDGGTPLTTDEMTGEDAKENMNLDFGSAWAATDGYPRIRANAEGLRMVITDRRLAVQESTSVFVFLEFDGSTVRVTGLSKYASNDTGVATVSVGSVSSVGEGTAAIEARYAGKSAVENVTVERVKPFFEVGVLDAEAVGTRMKLDARVTNLGRRNGTTKVAVDKGGDELATKNVTVTGDGSTTTTLSWRPSARKTNYTANVTTEDDFEVGEIDTSQVSSGVVSTTRGGGARPALPETSVVATSTETESTEDGILVTVTADVRNDGYTDREVSVTAEVGDVVTETLTGEVAGGETETFEFSSPVGKEGEHEVRVDGELVTTVTVDELDDETEVGNRTTEDRTRPTDGLGASEKKSNVSESGGGGATATAVGSLGDSLAPAGPAYYAPVLLILLLAGFGIYKRRRGQE